MLACLPTAVLKTKERQLLPTCCTCAIRHHQELKPQQLMLSFMKHCASTQSPYVSRIFVDYSIRTSSWTSDMQKRRYFNNNSIVSSHYFSFAISLANYFKAYYFCNYQKISYTFIVYRILIINPVIRLFLLSSLLKNYTTNFDETLHVL